MQDINILITAGVFSVSDGGEWEMEDKWKPEVTRDPSTDHPQATGHTHTHTHPTSPNPRIPVQALVSGYCLLSLMFFPPPKNMTVG